jgi:type I restriction enzyme M protein
LAQETDRVPGQHKFSKIVPDTLDIIHGTVQGSAVRAVLNAVRWTVAATPKTKDQILDAIFRDPQTKHGLKIFSAQDVEKLDLAEDGGRYYIRCAVTEKRKVAKPEEVVRQLTIGKLARDLGYPLTCMSVEVPIKMGSAYASKAADIVVYTDATKLTPYIIIEVKKPLRKDGLDQLHSYMNATGVYYGAWINGNDEVNQLRVEPNLFEELQRLPAVNEGLDDVKTPIKKSELKPIHDLKEEVQYLENAVLANAGVSAFEEIFKLIFAKLYDEFTKADDDAMEFRTTTATPQEQYQRLNGLFKRACAEWPDIFSAAERIELTPEALVAVASAFQTKRFFDADLDIVDAAFEYMINPEQKPDKGQFFTPRPVVKMCVKMLNPKLTDYVLDPACGPAGFLIHSLYWVAERYIQARFSDFQNRRYQYANSRLFGIDFDPRLSRVAKAMMLIAGDGRSNVYRVNSLDPREWAGRTDGLVSAIQDGKFDIVMTNPPFAGTISQPEIIGGYDLAYKGDHTKNKRVNKMTRDVLFIERCLRFLKPGGRMAIVLPQGNLNNTNAEYIRAWIMEKARVLAVVGLHVNTFKPFTGTKTSVLFLRKWAEDEDPLDDYPVFLAVNEKPVKDNTGAYILRRDPDGSYAVDSRGRRIIDHDLDDIADAFVEFAGDQGFGFWG